MHIHVNYKKNTCLVTSGYEQYRVDQHRALPALSFDLQITLYQTVSCSRWSFDALIIGDSGSRASRLLYYCADWSIDCERYVIDQVIA